MQPLVNKLDSKRPHRVRRLKPSDRTVVYAGMSTEWAGVTNAARKYEKQPWVFSYGYYYANP